MKKKFEIDQKAKNDFLIYTSFLASMFLAIMVPFAFLSCGTAKATNPSYAESIQTNMPGYQCFIIRDETGKSVGGSCVKE